MCTHSDLHVLAIDSNRKNLKLTCDILRKLNITKIFCAYDMDTALDIMKSKSNINLIIADKEAGDGDVLPVIAAAKGPDLIIISYSEKHCATDQLFTIVIGGSEFVRKTADFEDRLQECIYKWADIACLKELVSNGKERGRDRGEVKSNPERN